MKLISWNVNGIRAVAKKNALAWVDDIKPDILCLQEVKAQEEDRMLLVVVVPCRCKG